MTKFTVSSGLELENDFVVLKKSITIVKMACSTLSLRLSAKWRLTAGDRNAKRNGESSKAAILSLFHLSDIVIQFRHKIHNYAFCERQWHEDHLTRFWLT